MKPKAPASGFVERTVPWDLIGRVLVHKAEPS
jgi:hypothetical protein